uniref:Putative TmrB-like protein n=1 Tax=Streptosporangium amethystogenes TaxID=2002 RepID=M4ZQH3_9ACTN|nr:putative TmrB-like protein [Streptosporangium amethystogenes]
MIVIVTGPWALPRTRIARLAAGQAGGVEVVDGEQLGFALMEFRDDLPDNFQEDAVWEGLFTSLCVHTARRGGGTGVLAPMNVHSSERLSRIRSDIASHGEVVRVVGLRSSRDHCERLADSYTFFERESEDYRRVRDWQLGRLDEYLEFVEDPKAPVDHWIDLAPDAPAERVASSIAQAVTRLAAAEVDR